MKQVSWRRRRRWAGEEPDHPGLGYRRAASSADPNLVTISEIARRDDVTRSTVNMWIYRHEDFPARSPTRRRWTAVAASLNATGRGAPSGQPPVTSGNRRERHPGGQLPGCWAASSA